MSVSVTDGTKIEYRDIPGFDGYRAGSDGSVWCCRGRAPGHGRQFVKTNKWRRLAQYKNVHGRMVVTIRQKPRAVQRLVLSAFVGPCPEGMECCHENGNRADNRIENLRWDTRKANAADRDRHGTTRRGSRHAIAKLTEEKVAAIRRRYADGETQVRLAKVFGVAQGIISTIVRGKGWRHVDNPGGDDVGKSFPTNESGRLRQRESVSKANKRTAERLQCPHCKRKSALRRTEDAVQILKECRWCGYGKAIDKETGKITEHFPPK